MLDFQNHVGNSFRIILHEILDQIRNPLNNLQELGTEERTTVAPWDTSCNLHTVVFLFTNYAPINVKPEGGDPGHMWGI